MRASLILAAMIGVAACTDTTGLKVLGGATATAGTNSATQLGVASVALSPTSLTLAPGASGVLAAQVLGANGAALSGVAVSYSSSNESVASAAQNGTVTARGTGTATITATAQGHSATAQVIVASVVAASR